MKERSKLLGYYNYTVVLTYIGMLAGFTGILYAFERKPYQAVICLMTAGFCDMFDGAVASTMVRTKQEKCFGIQIDSLSDLICFGVLPAVISYTLAPESMVVMTVSCLYVLCALIRLAYFNVDEQERQEKESSSREVYYGLPVTLSALFVPILYAVGVKTRIRVSVLLSAGLAVMACLFLLAFKLRKPKIVGKI